MLLMELEAMLRQDTRSEEPVIPDLSGLDIDHILPQSWYAHWALPGGSTATAEENKTARQLEIVGGSLSDHDQSICRRASALNTLGNLTLLNLSVNREAQNKAFSIKKQLLIADTELRLNVPLSSRDTWDETAIAERAKVLADVAQKLYTR